MLQPEPGSGEGCNILSHEGVEVNRRMSPDSATFFLLLYQYNSVVGLLQGIMIL